MAQTHYAYANEIRDPRTAAMLSIVPGLGQFYNGESRKGALFLDVAIINYLLISLILFAPGIAYLLGTIGSQYGLRVNESLLQALHTIQVGSPFSLIVAAMLIAFVAYAVRDAWDHAIFTRRRAIYKDFIVELPEAASGSYIIHASVIAALAIMAMFFFIPQKVPAQLLEIRLINTLTASKQPAHTTTVSEHPNEARIQKYDPTKAIQKTPQKAELSNSQNKESKNLKQNDASPHSQNQTQPHSSRPASSAAAASASASASASAARVTSAFETDPKPIAIPKPIMLAQNFQPAKPIMAAVHPVTPPLMPRAIAPHLIASNPVSPKAIPSVMNPSKICASSSMMAPKALPNPLATANLPAAVMTRTAASTPAPPNLLAQLASAALPHGGSSKVMPAATAPSGGLMNAVQLPSTGGLPQLGSGPAFQPQAGTSSSRSGSPGITGVPGPVSIETRHPGAGFADGPVPDSTGRSSHSNKSGSHDGSGQNKMPAPVRAGRGPGFAGDGPIRIIPQGGPAGSDHSGAEDHPMNLPAIPGNNTPESRPDADFTRYMADLQRRIKRAWFPPKDYRSKKVKVMFKIHEGGEMGNLRISMTSGNSIADEAALAAVRNAAPFAHLPQYAPENVDIEFTFDYNVFNGI